MVVLASESITSWLSLPPHLSLPRTSRSPPCSRSGTRRCPCSSGSGRASRSPAPGRSPAGRSSQARRSRPRSPPPRDEGRRARGLAPRAARDVERSGSSSRALGARDRVPRARSAGDGSERSRRHALAPQSTRCPTPPSTTARSSSPGATGCAGSSRTRTSGSLSLPRRSRWPSSATCTRRRSATRCRRRTSSASCSGAARSRRSGQRRAHGPAGGRPAELYRFRERQLEVTDPFAVLRPPE